MSTSEVDDDHQHGADQDDAEQQRRVARGDRLLRQPAEARDGEDALDDDAAAEHGGRLQAEHGDQRQQRVARDVAQHDAPAREPRARAASTKSCRQASAMPARIMRRIERQIDEAERGDRQHQMAGDVERARRSPSCPRRWSRCRRSATSAAARRRRRSARGRARSPARHRAPASRSTAARSRRLPGRAPATMPSSGAEAEGQRGGAAHQQQRVGQPLEDDVEDRPAKTRPTSRGRDATSAATIEPEPRQRRLVEAPALRAAPRSGRRRRRRSTAR